MGFPEERPAKTLTNVHITKGLHGLGADDLGGRGGVVSWRHSQGVGVGEEAAWKSRHSAENRLISGPAPTQNHAVAGVQRRG